MFEYKCRESDDVNKVYLIFFGSVFVQYALVLVLNVNDHLFKNISYPIIDCSLIYKITYLSQYVILKHH